MRRLPAAGALLQQLLRVGPAQIPGGSHAALDLPRGDDDLPVRVAVPLSPGMGAYGGLSPEPWRGLLNLGEGAYALSPGMGTYALSPGRGAYALSRWMLACKGPRRFEI